MDEAQGLKLAQGFPKKNRHLFPKGQMVVSKQEGERDGGIIHTEVISVLGNPGHTGLCIWEVIFLPLSKVCLIDSHCLMRLFLLSCSFVPRAGPKLGASLK